MKREISQWETFVRKSWDSLVEVAALNPSIDTIHQLAEKGFVGRTQLTKKIQAIRWAMKNDGLTAEGVKSVGQRVVVSRYLKAMNATREPRQDVTMGVRLSQKPLLEAQIERLKELLGSKERPATTELVTDWLCSHIEQLSDDQIRNEAQGVG